MKIEGIDVRTTVKILPNFHKLITFVLKFMMVGSIGKDNDL